MLFPFHYLLIKCYFLFVNIVLLLFFCLLLNNSVWSHQILSWFVFSKAVKWPLIPSMWLKTGWAITNILYNGSLRMNLSLWICLFVEDKRELYDVLLWKFNYFKRLQVCTNSSWHGQWKWSKAVVKVHDEIHSRVILHTCIHLFHTRALEGQVTTVGLWLMCLLHCSPVLNTSC